MAQFAGQEQNLIVISDFQRTGWNRSSRESVIGHDVKAEMVLVGVADSTNVGIDNVSVDSTSFVRTYAGRIVARIHNYRRDKEVSVPVALLINDKEEARKTVDRPRRQEQAWRSLPVSISRWDLRRGKSRSWRTIRCRRTTNSFSGSNGARNSMF